MKKILIAFLFFGSLSYGQTKGISYQALIIDPVVQELPGFNNTQVPLANRNICLRFSFIDELNSLEYEEIFTTTTDDVGMVNLIIGTEDRTGGYASSFEDITWSSLPKNLKVDLSVNDGCSNFIEISNAPFTAVPFALFALNTENTPLVLDNEAEIILLKSLLATTQLGAGLNADGTYSPNASSNFITGATSLNNADTILDGQVKNNKDVITDNTTSIGTNRTAIGDNTTNITTNTSGIATNLTTITDNTTSIGTNTTGIATNTNAITDNTTSIGTNTTGIATNTTAITDNTTNITTNTSGIATNTNAITDNTTSIGTNTTGIADNTIAINERVKIVDIVDDLTTGGTMLPLSAEQGKVLKNLVDTTVNILVEDDLTSTSTTNALSANQGRELKGITDTNSTDIATNVTDIATNTSGIATNVTDIATNTSGIATNVTDIATNTSGITTNVTDIATNTSGIATNVTDIATNTSDIATNVTDIATNTSGIATNVTDIATNTSGIATNVTDITTNTSGIATNTSGIATNVTDIATNTSGIATNVTDIATNTSGIATNVTDIATNTSGIATNVTDIATNTSGIATNVTDIATNTSGIATNVTDIATNTSGIATNVTDIATNTSGIATNVTDIATNTSGIATNVTDIATNTSGIATNVTDIATNTSGIATNVTDIATNTSGIATNVTDIATNTSGIATNVTDIATNTSGIATNVTDIATNTSGITTNVTDIATNTSGIATNVTDIATNTSGIATNVTDIADNTTAISARVETADVVDDLTTGGTTVPLSAEQGKVLKGITDNNSTDVTLANTNYLSITDQEITGGTVPISSGGTGATSAPMIGVITAVDASAARTVLGVDATGTDNSTDVTLANTNYLSITDQEITGGTVPISSGGTGATSAPMIGVITAVDASAARTVLGVDATGTDNSTDVTLANTNYLSITDQEITGGTVPISSGGTGATSAPMIGVITAVDASAARTVLGVDATGTDNSTDVTLANTNYLSITDQEITGGTVPISSGGTGATSAPMIGVITAVDASAARTVLGVDATGTDNSTDVTLANTNYLSITDQEITGGTVPISSGGTGATSAPMIGVITAVDASAARTVLGVDATGTDNSTDVTLANTNYLSITDQEITGGTVPISSGGTGATSAPMIGVITAVDASAARTVLGVDATGTDNSTDVTLANTNYLSITDQEITGGTVPISSGGTGATSAPMIGVITAVDASAARTVLGVDATGTDNSTDVTLANTNYLSITDQEITGGTVPISSGGTGATSAPMIGVITAVDASAARTVLGVDATGTDNSTDVTLANTNYLSITDQEITGGTVPISSGGTGATSAPMIGVITAVDASAARTVLGVDATGTDNSTDVTLANTNYLSITDQEITGGTVPISSGGTGATSAPMIGVITAVDASAARTVLGVDATGTDNSTDVTLANTNYLSITDQEITGGTVPISSGGTGATSAPMIGVITAVDASAARTVLGVDATGTDNSTDVTLANTNYLSITDQEITGGTVPISSGGTGATSAPMIGVITAVDASAARTVLGVDATGTDNSTDVTLANTNYLSITDQEITGGTVPISSGGTGATSAPMIGVITAVDASAARTVLGVDATGTDNSTDVTLANTNYLSITDQEITGGTVPISSGGTGATSAPMIGVITAVDASAARTVLGVDATGTDNSTDVTLANTNYLSITDQEITGGTVPISSGGTGATSAPMIGVITAVDASAARTVLGVDATGTDNSTDVTLANTNYLSITDQEITGGTVPISSGGTGATSAPMIGVITAVDASAARTVLGVDATGTDNSTDVTLANTNYLSITDQEITGGTVPISSGGTGATSAPMIGVITAVDASAARTVLGVDATGTDNSTDVTLANTNYLSITDQEITGGTVPISSGGTGATSAPMIGVITAVDASAARTVLGVDATGTDNSTDVTLANTNYLSITDQEITGGTVPISSGGTGATSAPMIGVITAVDASAARTVLGVDATGTDNSTDVTLANTNYLSITDQEITGGTVPISSGGTGATSAPMIGVITAVDASAARTVLGVDATGTDNSTDVTLATVTGNYLSLTDQEITVSTIPLSLGGTGATTATAARTNLGLVIGTNVQAYDAQLADVAGLTVTDGNIIVGDGTNFVAESDATARTSLGLGTADNVTFNNITGNLIGNILDSNGNELVKGTATASAVNEITVTNAATGNGPTISASGGDDNVDLNIEAKGTGVVNTTGDLTVGGAMDVTGSTSMAAINSDGVVTLSDNTTSTSSTTGALKVTGGVGIAENLNIGGTIDVTGATTMAAITSDGVVTLSDNTTSTSSTTGALKVTGGVGIAENLNVGGTIDVTGATTMAAITSDGVVTLSDNTTSTSSTTGALKVTGGVGIAENLNVGGAINVTDAATTRNNLGVYSGILTWSVATGPGASTETFSGINGVTTSSVIIVTKNGGDSTIGFIESAICSTNGSITIKTTTSLTVGTKISYFIIN